MGCSPCSFSKETQGAVEEVEDYLGQEPSFSEKQSGYGKGSVKQMLSINSPV